LTPAAYDGYSSPSRSRGTLKPQEELGLDVLVHGESSATTWWSISASSSKGSRSRSRLVQSYGSPYVKPPIIYGDVSRPKAMTVRWSTFANPRPRAR